MRHRPSLLLLPLLMAIGMPAASAQAQKDPFRPTETQVEPVRPEDSQPWVSPGDVGWIPTDTETTIPVTAYNYGVARSDLRLVLSKASRPTRFVQAEAVFGDLAADSEASANIRIETTETDPCVEDLLLEGTLSWTGGSAPASISLLVRCPGPRLYQQSVRYVGGDEDGVPERGETLEVFVTYGNNGADPATGLRAELTVGSDGVEVLTGTAAWPDIAPDGAGENLTPFVLRFADDAPLDPGCSWGGPDPRPIDPAVTYPAEEGGTSGDAGASSAGTGEDGIAQAPAPESTSVAYEGALRLTSNETTLDDFLGSLTMCALAESAGGAPTARGTDDGTDLGSDGGEEVALAPSAARGAGGGATPIALALGLLAAVSLYLARRSLTQTAASAGHDG